MLVIADLCASSFYVALPSNDHKAAAIAIWRAWAQQMAAGTTMCQRCGRRVDGRVGAIVTHRGLAMAAKCSRHVMRATIARLARAGWIKLSTAACARHCLTIAFVDQAPTVAPALLLTAGESPCQRA
jgi:hypothetical protein